MSYKPCRNCARDKSTCETRLALQRAIKGHHVSFVNFRCKDREPMFHPGQRVSFPWSHWEPNDWGDSDENRMIFNGTVIYETGTKFVVRVDEMDGAPADENSEEMPSSMVFRNHIIKVRTNELIALSEPDRTVCAACCGFESEVDKCHGYGDPKRWDAYWPTECLRNPEAEDAA